MFRLKNILKPFFYRYDCDGNESLDKHELSAVFVDLGMLDFDHTNRSPINFGYTLVCDDFM